MSLFSKSRLPVSSASALARWLMPTSSTSGASETSAFMAQQTRGPRWWKQPQNEMSRHRTRPPTYGLQMKVKVNVVDNSPLAKQALLHYRVPYIISVFKQGWRPKHMPKAVLGDKVTVVVKGEVKRALIVGYRHHYSQYKHGVVSTDINNVVLLDKEGNPLGTRILVPIPSALRHMRADPTVGKVLAIATQFI